MNGYQRRQQAISRSPRVSTIALAISLLFPLGAHAAIFTASNEAQLLTAINNANANPGSSIQLTGNFTITNPAALPAIASSVTIDSGVFTLTTTGTGNFNVNSGTTLTMDTTLGGTALGKSGVGTFVYTGTGSTLTNGIVVTGGELRVQNGGQITFGTIGAGNGLSMTNDNANATVTGAGSIMNARNSVTLLGSAGGNTLTISAGGQFLSTGAMNMAQNAGTSATLNVDGAGSLLSVANLGNTINGTAFINITNGGRIENTTGSVTLGGTPGVAAGGSGVILISGANSRWDSSGGPVILHDGSLTVLDGGVMNGGRAMTLGTAGKAVTVIVSGQNSSLLSGSVFGANMLLRGDSTMTVANGGSVVASNGTGLLTLSNTAIVNIGGAEG
jgi:T5SS/PEP-CTERM-associated repeat protein